MARGPYGVFETRDGKFLTLGIVEDFFWARFCRVAGLSELAEDPALQGWVGRNRQAARLKPLLARVFRERDREDWLAALAAADVPVAPVHDLEEWRQDPQLLARGFFAPPAPGADPLAGLPHFPLPAEGPQAPDPPREMPVGRDSQKWLLAQGLKPREISSLREQGII